ncbi:polysaccharide deacetylase family sporulation protein PdaB [Alteribacillus persepolensis]|uniref:Polysaccharide deacetylase family sporulation protein PdaB n=1 Tax=Alteribacillus persepolensis TaxID=568899 RepID=A0A1G8HMZ4_9BACI|nr:polysaccharide deacetylase family sporulation protein PdaB [Alteribacillus persepolensis]SDI07952.1 polysaccharide deacetylase family sporulation protein PdaB [Alteribacillus persepolensis]
MPKKVWIIRSKTLKLSFVLLLGIFIVISGLMMNSSFLPVFSTSEGPAAFYRADIDEKKVALTFNISWGEDKALPILDILKEKDVTAAFFISGAWAERHPEIVERMLEDGHTLGNHGYRYEHYPRLEEKEVISDLNLSHKKIKDVTEQDVKYFRPPHGDINEDVLKIIDNFGYSVVHWSVGGNDWENPGVDTIVQNITDEVKPGDVILLHASDSAKQTSEALPIIIDNIRGANYSFVDIEELISQAETNMEEVR